MAPSVVSLCAPCIHNHLLCVDGRGIEESHIGIDLVHQHADLGAAEDLRVHTVSSLRIDDTEDLCF